MEETAKSKNDVTIRLTDERWTHVTEEHCELAGMRLDVLDAIANPERIFEGRNGELFAIKEIEDGKRLVVVYRETSEDGFVITAFLTRKMRSLERRKLLWP